MKLDEYQQEARKTAVYPDDVSVLYPLLGLIEEVGELCGKVAKALRKSGLKGLEELDLEAITREAGDVDWQRTQLLADLGISAEYCAKVNLAKLADRAERGVLKGEGDNR